MSSYEYSPKWIRLSRNWKSFYKKIRELERKVRHPILRVDEGEQDVEGIHFNDKRGGGKRLWKVFGGSIRGDFGEWVFWKTLGDR